MNLSVFRWSRVVLTRLLPGWRQRRDDQALTTLARELAVQGRVVLATARDPSGRPALVFAEAHTAEIAGCRMPGAGKGEEGACLEWLRAEGWMEAVEAAHRRAVTPADGHALCVHSDDGLPLCCH